MLSQGVLGYTTKSTLFSETTAKSFAEELEDVLVNKVLVDLEPPTFPQRNPEREYEKHFEFFSQSSGANDYFDFDLHPQRHFSFKSKIKTYLKWYWPSLYQTLFLTRVTN